MQVKNISNIQYFLEKTEIIDSPYEYTVKYKENQEQIKYKSAPTFIIEFTNCIVNGIIPFLITEENDLITEHIGPLNYKTKEKPKKIPHSFWTKWTDPMNIKVARINKSFNESDKFVWLPIDPNSANNPWHVWIDIISKFRLLEKRYAKRYTEFVYILSHPSPYFDKVVKECFPNLKYFVMETNDCWSFTHLIVPSMSNSNDGVTVPLLPQWLRTRFAPKPNQVKKIFLDRKTGSRRLSNRDEVIAILKGWEVVAMENLSIKDQMETFATASHIISTHGAGLINLLWCKKNTKIIEIAHKYTAKKVYPVLGHHLNLNYKVLIGDAIEIPKTTGTKKFKRLNDYNNIKLNSNILLQNLD